MTAALSRRRFLFGCTALVGATMIGRAAWADANPFRDLSNFSRWSPAKKTQRINELAVSNYAKKNIPIKPTETKIQYKARIKNLVEKMNSTAEYAVGSSRAAAQAAAANSQMAAAEAAAQKSMFGMMGGMGRLGLRMGVRALNWIALGTTIWYVGSFLYNAIWGATETAQDLSCAVGTTCKVTVNGKTSVQATTREYANAQSSWSLSNHNWYVRKSTRVAPPDGKPGYFIVYWNWQEHNGMTAATFDPQTEFSPYQRGVGQSGLSEALRNSGNLSKGISRREMAELLDQAVAGAVAQNPEAFPDGWAESKPGVPDKRPEVTADDFWMYDDGVKDVKFGDYISGIAEGVQDGIEAAFDGLFNPEDVAQDVVSDIPDTYVPPQTGGTPTPSPTPTPTPGTGGSTGCAPGSAGCPAVVDWGKPPVDDAIPSVKPTSWFPTLFTPPQLPGQCESFEVGVPFLNASVPLDPCPPLAAMPSIVRKACIGTATVLAGKVLLDT